MSGVTDVVIREKDIGPTSGDIVTAWCSSDERLVSGGVKLRAQNGGIPSIFESAPVGPDGTRPSAGSSLPLGSGWFVYARNVKDTGEGTISFTAYALCARR